MRIGIRAHDYGKMSAEKLAESAANDGLSSVQLAISKAVEGIENDTEITTGLAYHIGREFSKRDIQIAVLGCYINPIDENKEMLNKQLERFCEHIRFAKDFGASIIGTETGNKKSADDFNTLVSSVARLVEEAEKFGVFVGIEGVHCNTIDSPQTMKKLVDIISSNNLQVIFDPVNYLNYENYKEQDRIISDSFELFGDKIQIIHAKDFTIKNNSLKNVQIGKGMLNYDLIKQYLNDKKPYINVLMEGAEINRIKEMREFLSA